MKPRDFATAALVIVSALIVGSLAADFRARLQPEVAQEHLPRTAVVFTGQFDRIRFGLRLLEEGRVDRLFVSGVNEASGLDPDRFAAVFGLSPRLRAALAEGRIVLARRATSTLQNAGETACWLALHPDIQDVVLITSFAHMPRASLVLERALPAPFQVVRLSADSEPRQLPTEVLKFAAASIITLLPSAVWARGGSCTLDRTPARQASHHST